MIGPLKNFPDPNPLNGANATYLEDLYQSFVADPQSVDEQWQDYFRSLEQEVPAAGPHRQSTGQSTAGPLSTQMSETGAAKQAAVMRMINAYRVRGHQQADSDPLNFYERAKDQIGPEEIDIFDAAESVVIDGAGHMLHFEQPQALAKVIESFLGRDL